MEAHAGHHHHELPTEGSALSVRAVSAALHCLTGCAIGEVVGMAIGTALGLSDWATVGLAVVLAFLFGYSLGDLLFWGSLSVACHRRRVRLPGESLADRARQGTRGGAPEPGDPDRS